jgi:hypothetical protein
MNKTEIYHTKLTELENWDEYLLQESGLPGPRGNIELAQVVADEGDRELFMRYLKYEADLAPVGSPYEFLPFCGVVGLGRLLAEGATEHWGTLRRCASDTRWRMREGVAMALQRLGAVDMDALLAEMNDWSKGTPLEQRAAAAAICEPALLKKEKHAQAVLQILDSITASISGIGMRRDESFIALKKGLGYCWSVAAAAAPLEGKRLMEKWFATTDSDIRWIMKENLKKNRLMRIDPEWVGNWQKILNKS